MDNCTVWILEEQVDYEGSSIVAVFDSFKKGIAYAEKLAEIHSKRCGDIGGTPKPIYQNKNDEYRVSDITWICTEWQVQ